MPAYNNSFASPSFIEETIIGADGRKIGSIRIKPSSVLWKPTGQQKFYSVSLETFAVWITSQSAKSKRITS